MSLNTMFNPLAPTVNGAIKGLKKALDDLKKVQQYHREKGQMALRNAEIETNKSKSHLAEAYRADAIHKNISTLISPTASNKG